MTSAFEIDDDWEFNECHIIKGVQTDSEKYGNPKYADLIRISCFSIILSC